MAPITRSSLVIALLVTGGCSCSGNGGRPITAPGVPPAQTIEGGSQIVLSPAGLAKVTSSITAQIADQFGAASVCISPGSYDVTLGEATPCASPTGGCPSGCRVAPSVDDVSFAVTGAQAATVSIHFGGTWTIPIASTSPLYPACTLGIQVGAPGGGGGTIVDADIALAIDASTGRLHPTLTGVGSIDLSSAVLSGCADLQTDHADLIAAVRDAIAGELTIALVTSIAPIVESLDATPGSGTGEMPIFEARFGDINAPDPYLEWLVTSGGYVRFASAGLTYGVLTGFNSDYDRATRTAALWSEPHPCVAANALPDFAAPPHSLAPTSRGTFTLPASDTFAGAPFPQSDFTIGTSEATLDLLFHHHYAAGAACVSFDGSVFPFLHRDALDDLVGVPLDTEDALVRLTSHPTTPFDASIVDLGATSAGFHASSTGLGLAVDEVDANTTMELVRVSTEMEFRWGLAPIVTADETLIELVDRGMATADTAMTSSSDRYAGLGATERGALASAITAALFNISVFDSLRFPVPTLFGFELEDVVLDRISTASDDFLALQGNLVPVATTPPLSPAPTPAPTSVVVDDTSASAVRNALASGVTEGLPTVHVSLPSVDGGGRPLEHGWRLTNGLWHPYEAVTDLVVRDARFAWQGTHRVDLRSRVVGDASTESAFGAITVTIDFAPPTVFTSAITRDASGLHVPARDTVSGTMGIELAAGPMGATEPTTGWVAGDTIPASVLIELGDSVVVFVRDEAGHVASASYDFGSMLPDAGVDGRTDRGNGGCGCVVGGTSARIAPMESVLLALVVWVLRRRRRDRRLATQYIVASCK